MPVPVSITAPNFTLPASAEKLIRKRCKRLERIHPRMIHLTVVIEGPGGHHRRGGPFDVRIRIGVPGEDLVIDRQDDEDLLVAVAQAFDAARRRLEDHVRLERGQVKRKEPPPRGKVARIFPREGYGFLITPEGREVYFHRNSVQGPGFDRLTIGTEVVFSEEQGQEGPQASTLAAAS